MDLDIDTVNKAIVAGVPALILAVGGGITAKRITRGIEKMKLDHQEAIEKQRLEFQESIERERMQFQREAEAQKQRMELYKTLYQERVAAVKELMRVTGEMRNRAFESYTRDSGPPAFEEVKELGFKIVECVNANEWLFTEEVSHAATGVQVTTLLMSGKTAREDGFRDGERNAFKEASEARACLAAAISRMMLHDDLSRLVENRARGV